MITLTFFCPQVPGHLVALEVPDHDAAGPPHDPCYLDYRPDDDDTLGAIFRSRRHFCRRARCQNLRGGLAGLPQWLALLPHRQSPLLLYPTDDPHLHVLRPYLDKGRINVSIIEFQIGNHAELLGLHGGPLVMS